jgi:hypothetical protein
LGEIPIHYLLCFLYNTPFLVCVKARKKQNSKREGGHRAPALTGYSTTINSFVGELPCGLPLVLNPEEPKKIHKNIDIGR